MLNVETIFFVTIHADLSQNLLCCHLFIAAIYSEIVRVEKKGQISGMPMLTVLIKLEASLASK